MSDKYDQLQKLKQLHDEGVLTADEYRAEKTLILSSAAVTGGSRDFWGMEERTFCMLLHLSQLLGVVLPFIPFIGLIVPVVMWTSEKDKSRAVDKHGRIVLNWAISYIIYFAISLVLIVILIGGLLLVAVIVANIVFAIIGGIKASNGEFWKYPLSIPFFGVPDEPVGVSRSSLSGTGPRTGTTSTLSSNTTPSSEGNEAAKKPGAASDPIAAESSSLNAGKAKKPAKSATGKKREDVPAPDSAAPRPKATPEKGTPPGSADDDKRET